MKIILLCSTILFLVFNTAQTHEFNRVEDKTSIKTKNLNLNSRKTSKIRLSNGLNVYLVSDPKADKSSAALSMHTGSWSDTQEYPGTAHFLEHLLFMGSKTYPDENAYMKQISDNGGTCNAYTAPDRTVYMFSVNNHAFETTLDMFSHMFIDPLFNPSGIARELHAVDQEHDKNIENDNNRVWMIFKETGNSKHPNALFSTGNSSTLGKIPPEDVNKWFQLNYSADKAHLILYSTLPIEELESMSVEYFSSIHQSPDWKPETNAKLFSNNQMGHIIHVNPIKDLRSLSIWWELPKNEILDMDHKIPELIAYILGGKYESSLYSQLKHEKLIEDLSAGIARISHKSGFFYVDFDLTPQGVSEANSIMERLFQTLNGLKLSGVPKHIFDEIKTMSIIDYEYQSRSDAFEFTSTYAHNMIDEPLESFPQKTFIPTKFNPLKVQFFLNLLTPEKAIYFLQAPKGLSNIEPNITEKWSGAEYSTEKIPTKKLSEWNVIDPNPNIELPQPNQLIPNNLSLISQFQEDNNSITPTPQLLVENDFGKVYFWKDSQYSVPEINWTFNIKSPLLDGTSTSKVMLDIFNLATKEKLSDMLFYASAASLETKIYSDNLTLKYNISGYSEKAPLLLNSILNEIKDIKITKEEFDLYSTSLKSSYLNIGQAIPILQANEIMQNILSNVSPKHNEQVAALNNVSYEDFLIFCSNLFIKSYIEVLLIGNIDEKEASQVWETVQKELNHNSYPTSEHIKKRMLVLPPSKGPYKICEKTSSLGNAVILAIHEGPFSYQNKASATVLGLALQEDFFDTLRTKQQTGYITRAFTQEEQKQLYQYFLVQSTTHHPEELIARFELFLETYSKDFESMIEEGRFEMIRNSLISDLNTPPTNLTEMARLLNSLAFTYEGDFQRIEKFTTALKSLTYEKLKVDAIKFLSRKNNKRVAVLLEGNQPEEKSFCYEEVNAASIKKEGSYISSP